MFPWQPVSDVLKRADLWDLAYKKDKQKINEIKLTQQTPLKSEITTLLDKIGKNYYNHYNQPIPIFK